MSLLDSSNANQDEKEMQAMRRKMREIDSDYREWEEEWEKRRREVHKVVNSTRNKSWDNFCDYYE
jgi:hypothetical protein